MEEEYDILRESVKSFSEKEIMPVSRKIDHDDYFPREIFKKMGSIGYLGITIPEEYGGSGSDYISQAIIEEEISYASGSIGLSYGAHSNLCLDNLYRNGSEYIRENYVPKLCSGDNIGSLGMTEPSSGSDALSMKTNAVKDGVNYVINGSKTFITNAPYADQFLTYARTGDNYTAFLILSDDEGFSRGKRFEKLGMRGSPTGEIYFNNIKLKSDRIVGGLNNGKRVLLSGLNMERAVLSFNAIGIARRALDLAVEYSIERNQFGKPIHEFELIQEKLAYMYTKFESSRLFALEALKRVNNDKMDALDAAAAILYASESSEYIAREALQIFGGYGYIKDFEIERVFRDSILLTIGAGTNEIRKKVISESLIKKYKK
ncbi:MULTISPECIES: acyl-CoA dehydrogenase family protein [unclassified Acidiplasma]|uniref:acyl-CoA dehydrogenase family protein n=1 Tax=unclassified Acidiplasma TaxID=2641301 RepID=UPI0005E2523E|nr:MULTISPECIES: acyl-CoA dehydrogenase family protein [unclassified Acidiplasma]KJE48623.1 isovaleryl-CoA dehydrogenase [Acidiplasma sp. MBA-1]WMT55375.1 MAG: acyl-CoA dehydrogenase family protein [Acidiplasma sp.]